MRYEVTPNGDIVVVQDVSLLLKKLNKERATTKGWSKGRNLKKVAEIPAIYIQSWTAKYGHKFVQELLQDPDLLIKFIKKYHREVLL